MTIARLCTVLVHAAAIVAPGAMAATTYYVRTDGGSASQCTGLVDAAYPGSGSSQPCAWAHPFWALDGAGAWRIQGGDTLSIGAGSYRMGYGAPNTGWCDPLGAWDCHLPALPSGTAATPTRLVGSGWSSGCAAKPELWGVERSDWIVSLDGTNDAIVACLEVTDHSGCVENHPTIPCERNNPPYGDWAPSGIYAAASARVTLRDLDIHGLGTNGILNGGLTDWTVEGVRIAGNGGAGWNGDIGPGSSCHGTLLFDRVTIEWNGCAETYPGRQPDHCWAQQAGGYGDGLGTSYTSGDWIFRDCLVQYNTSDGLDMLYAGRDLSPSTVTVERMVARGNAGNQIKVGGNSFVVNSLMVGNCAFFDQKPFAQEFDAADNCRAGGSALSMDVQVGDAAWLVNSTIVGEGDCLVEEVCETGGCNGSESFSMQNSVFRGYVDWRQPWEQSCFVYYGSLSFPGTQSNDYNLVFDAKDDTSDCAAGASNICNADPLFQDGSLATFDGHLRAGSPALDNGLPVGALGGRVPANDLDGLSRPVGAGVDRGAYEHRVGLVDYLVGEGCGQPNPNRVRAFTATGGSTAVDLLAYSAGQWGVRVAEGNVDGGSYDEILTGPGPGAVFGPQVRGFQRTGSSMGKINYYAYGTLRYGVNVASGKLDADGYDEILTGPGPGTVFGPHVRGWDFDAVSIAAIAKINFFAYGTLKYGVNASSGDVERDGFAEMLTGPGPGAIFGTQVRGFNYDGAALSAIAKINFVAFAGAYYGANVQGGDVDADQYAEIAVTHGAGAALQARFRGFNYDGASIAQLPGYDVVAFTSTGGGRVGLGDLTADGRAELLAAPGPDPAIAGIVKSYTYDGVALSLWSTRTFTTSTYGANVAGASLGY